MPLRLPLVLDRITNPPASRLTVMGQFVAASVDEDCMDKNGYAILENLKPTHYCGRAFDNKFVASYEVMEVDMVYNGPEARHKPK